MMKNPKVLVIGLDGGTWNLLKPWAERRKLPAFKKLMTAGVYGTSITTIPPVTGPAWVSFATGKNPGKHGIFDFVKLEENHLRPLSPTNVGCDTFYNMLSEKFSCIIMGLPLSYPPGNNFNGIMISDFLYPNRQIFPKTKSQYLRNYSFPDLLLESKEDLLNDIIKTATNRIETAKKMFSKEIWDFFFLWYGETDWVSHFFWDDIKYNTRIGQKAKFVFQIIDGFLCWLLKRINNNCYLFIVSDHGFGDCPHNVALNQMFLESGLLKKCLKDVSQEMTKEKLLGIKRKEMRVPKFVFKIFDVCPFVKSLSASVLKLLFGDKVKATYETGIDFENSNAFVPTSEAMGIYVNESNQKKKKVIEDITETLEHLEYKGHRVFKRVLCREEVYSGSHVGKAPDIMLIPDGFHITSNLDKDLFGKFNDGGYHDSNGIFLAYGPDIKKGAKIENVRIYDMAPTILHIYGLPIPIDVDGRVLMEIFEDQSEKAKRTPTYIETSHRRRRMDVGMYSPKDEEEIKKRLKELGYL